MGKQREHGNLYYSVITKETSASPCFARLANGKSWQSKKATLSSLRDSALSVESWQSYAFIRHCERV